MLTSFFSKSKPVNFLVVAILMAIFYILVNFINTGNGFGFANFLEKAGTFTAFILSIGVLNFIARKNELTKRSDFKILIFAVFALSFPAILKNHHEIVANLFLLLALRRIVSLKSRKEIRKKIFDATFWICIASLFYFWSILFLIVVYAAVLLHTSTYVKNWLIPQVAIFSVILLVTGFHLLIYDRFYTLHNWYQESSSGFSNYREVHLLVPLIIILVISLWALFFYFIMLQKASIRSRPTYIIVLFSLLIAIAVAIMAPTKNGSELLFSFVPLSIIISNYFEGKGGRWVKQILLAVLILMPFLIPVLF